LNKGKSYKEVIDGQQRLRAIFEFKEGEFKILPEHNEEYQNMNYENLPDEAKEAFLSYRFPVEIVRTEDEGLVYDIFARMNTVSMTLNKQELRNAKFWGYFKTLSYKLAKEYKNLWIDLKTFSDIKLARREDVEFMSSLMIATLDGIITEKPEVINGYYKKYDENFEKSEEIENKIVKILEMIKELLLENDMADTLFKKPNAIYDLYIILLHSLYSVKHLEGKHSVDILDLSKLSVVLKKFDSEFKKFKKNYFDENSIEYKLFSEYRLLTDRKTTDSKQRIARISLIIKYITANKND
jgi:hypothetical protein